jgi:hypothetical protein
LGGLFCEDPVFLSKQYTCYAYVVHGMISPCNLKEVMRLNHSKYPTCTCYGFNAAVSTLEIKSFRELYSHTSYRVTDTALHNFTF